MCREVSFDVTFMCTKCQQSSFIPNRLITSVAVRLNEESFRLNYKTDELIFSKCDIDWSFSYKLFLYLFPFTLKCPVHLRPHWCFLIEIFLYLFLRFLSNSACKFGGCGLKTHHRDHFSSSTDFCFIKSLMLRFVFNVILCLQVFCYDHLFFWVSKLIIVGSLCLVI